MKPVVKSFKSTTVWNAFILNSVVSTLIVFIALMLNNHFTKHVDKEGREVKTSISGGGIIAILLITFATSMMAYGLMYVAFGFGGGMLVS